ncbi:MAG: hypothetical protein U5J82_10405 [Desulfobacterales bacterium]|nr:hypothetical protein [Desulfobacterales bacterium]
MILTPGGNPFSSSRDLYFDPINDILGVLAVAHDNNAADRLTFAVHIEHATTNSTAGLHRPQIFDVDRRTAHVGADHDIFKICLGLHIAAATDEVFGICLFNQTPPTSLLEALTASITLATFML